MLQILIGGKKVDRPGHFVEPTIVSITHDAEIVQVRTSLALLMRLRTVDQAHG